MEITKEQEKKLGEWLTNISAQISCENDHVKKTSLNAMYIGGIKLLNQVGGYITTVNYYKHLVNLTEMPRVIDISEFSTRQTQGAAEMLTSAGIYPTIHGKRLTV